MKLTFWFVVLFLGLTSVQAQELVKTDVKTPDEVAERVRLLEAELERQNAKLDQLQKTIEQQQSALQALLEKLSVPLSAKSPAAETPTPNTVAETEPAPQ